MLNSSYDKIGLNLKFERAFVLVLETILGSSAVTNCNGNSTTYYHPTRNEVRRAEWSKAHRFECLVIVVVRGSSPGITICFFFLESN